MAACSLDDVIAVILGGIISTLAMNKAPKNTNPESVGKVILTLIMHLGTGLLLSLLAFLGMIFNKMKNNRLR